MAITVQNWVAVDSCTLGHLLDGLGERVIGGETADAAAKAAIQVQRHENAIAFLLEDSDGTYIAS